MNNDFLAGILKGSTGPNTALQTGKKHNTSETGNFMSLLQDRLAFDADQLSGSTQSKVNFSFRANSGNGDLNPLYINSAETKFLSEENPAEAITSERSQENYARSESTAFNKTDEYSRIETSNSEKVNHEDETKATDKQTIESLLSRFSPEDQETLINALQQLSPQDLQVLAESPGEFQNKLIELIEDMPASEEQSALLDLVNRPEFMNLLTAVSEAIQEQKPVQAVVETTEPELQTTRIDSEETIVANQTGKSVTDKLNQAVVPENDTEANKVSEVSENTDSELVEPMANGQEVLAAATHKSQVVQLNDGVQKPVNEEQALKAMTGNAGDQAIAAANAATAANTSEDATASDDASASEKNGEAQEKLSADKASEKQLKAEVKAESQVEHASLRQEFKKLNETQSGSETGAEGATDDSANSSAAPQTQTQTQSHGANPSAVTAEVKPALEEAARRFFSLLGDKAPGQAGKSEGQVFSAINAESGRKNVQTAGSSNHAGLNNGYAYQSGGMTTANSATRTANAVPVTSAAFAELLDKAEFVKTRNGGQVLNIELDPKELGKMSMELTSKDGAVTARISAENSMAKAKLDELAPQIKEQLLSQGVNLTEITVDISSRDPNQSNENQASGGNNKSSRISAAHNKEDADTIIRRNILPNLRRAALNIQAVDMTV
ncbi:MAG TPA: flagellar hook-length control protein FliK [Candidatus Rifleibacterium sp.]|nr:flagellar hook-length control protein FliK [Candidatus Rifleibacterium sp.]HPT48136.1 flagellar hook-length control protein FliK [Candidatus Rifleibacterium sp.]